MKSRAFDPQIESMSRKELKTLQFKKLKELLERLYNKNAFYKERFDKAKVKPEDIKSFDDFNKRIPLLSKEDCLAEQTKFPPYGRRAGVPEEDIFQIQLTSGTSGKGQEVFVVTKKDDELSGRTWANFVTWSGFTKGDIVFNFFPMSTGSAGLSLYGGLRGLNANVMLAAPYDVDTKISHMTRFKPHFVLTTPSYLLRLTVACNEKGINPKKDISRLKGLLIAAEAYPIEFAERMEEFWGVKLYEMYGSTQFNGTMACTCENSVLFKNKRGALHVLEHNAYVEINDPNTGEPVEYGQDGEIVLTTLYRMGSPVVRFSTKDKIRLLPPDYCDCGRPFMLLESGTVSRYDDMIKMKATNIWPQTVDDLIFTYSEVEESHGRVYLDDQGREQVAVEIEFKQGVDESRQKEILAALPEKIKAKTDVSMSVKKVEHGKIKRSDFKARRWSDERSSGLKKVSKM